MAQIKLAEYTFDSTNESTNMPSLTPNTITMTTEDVVISDTVTKRIVYIDNAVMPTKIKMGGLGILEVYYLNIDSNITDMNRLFHYSGSLTYVNTEGWDTKNVTDMACMFEATKLTKLDLSHWNTSNVKDASYMFCNTPIKSVNLNGWDMSKVTNCRNMFAQSSSLERVDMALSTNLSACATFFEMFSGCKKLKTVKGTDTWKVQNATDFSSMFSQCNSLQDIKGLEDWNVSSVTSFGSMFQGCSSLTKLDLRNWVTSSAYNMAHMFNSCSSLEVLRVDNFDTSNVGDSGSGIGMNGMFQGCSSLKTLNLNSFTRGTNLTKITAFLQYCESLEYLSMQNFDFSGMVTFQSCFNSCKSLKMLDLTMWDTSSASSATFTYCFNGVTCPIYYNSNICTNTTITSLSKAIDVKGRLMAVYDFNNTVTTSDSAYPVLTGSTVTKTIDTQGSESHITHRVIGVDVMPTAISFNSIRGLLNVDYLAVTSSCTSLVSLFENCFRMTYVDTFGWDTSNVTRFGYCFRTCSSLTEIRNIQDLKVTSKVTEAYDFFNGCSKLTSLDLTHWDVSGIKNGSVMFKDCSGLTSLNISNWDVSSMQFGNSMFQGCTSLSELDLTSFKTTAMESDNYNMFSGWTSDQIVYIHDTNWTIDVSSYNATFVRRLSTLLARYTFDNSVSDCLPKFNSTILPSSPNYKISDMVNGTVTTRLISVDDETLLPTRIHFSDDGYTAGRSILTCDYLDISNCTSLHLLFYGCNKLTYVNTSSWNTSKVETFEYAFRGTQITTLDTTNIDVSNAINLRGMFDSCSRITSLDLSSWNVSKTRTLNLLFKGCYSLTSLDISTWDTSNVDNMGAMFDSVGITELDLSHFITSKVTTMSSMFSGCKIQKLDLSSWDVSKVSDTGLMFYSNAIKEINVDGWNTENFNNMYGMFCSCGISKIDVSHFKTSKATNMSQLFDRCYNLTSVGDLSNWDTSSVTNMTRMFDGCAKLTELNVAGWDTRKVTSFSGIFNGWTSAQTVYYEPPYWSIGTTTLNSNINWVIQVTRNNGYWLDMTGITGATEITLFNENNLPTEEILTDWGDGTQDSNLTHTYSTAGEYVVVSNLQNRSITNSGAFNSTIHSYLTKANIFYRTNPNHLFYNCNKLTEVTFTDNWVENLGTTPLNFWRFFAGCQVLTTFNTDVLCKLIPKDMGSMFEGCKSLTELDLSKLNTENVIKLDGLFNNCSALTKIIGVENWNVSNCTNMTNMFNSCSSLTSLDVSSWNFEKCTTINQFIRGTTSLVDFNMSGVAFGATGVNFQNFAYQSGVQNVNMSNITTAGKVSFESSFYGCGKLKTIDFNNSHFKPSNMQNMFSSCKALTSLDLSMLDTSVCTNMANTFTDCNSLVSLDLSHFDTSSVTNLDQIFRNMISLQSLNVSNWDVSKVTAMTYGFSNCGKLKELDLSSFVFNSNCNCNYLLRTMPSLEVLDFSNYSTPKVGNFLLSDTKLKTIGMLYSSAESINEFTSKLLSGDTSTTDPYDMTNRLTIYYYDADPSQLTPVEGVTFKKYQVPTTIQLPPHIQLHSLPDGTRDEVDIKTGILTHNIGYKVYDETKTWSIYSDDFYYCSEHITGTTPCFYTQLPFKTSTQLWDGEEGYSYGAVFMVRKHGIKTKEEFLEYIAKNPIPVVYGLSEPTTEQLILNYNNSCDYGRILPTGMCDKYSVVNSMYTQTMASILLDGANTWDAMEEFGNTVKFTATGTTVGVENLNMLGAGGLYCDNDLFPNINDDSDVPHCRVDEAGNKFYIYISKDRLMSPDLIGWQIWLQANNFNLIYELAKHLTYIKPYEELDATQARWEGMDCMRDGAINYHANNSDNLTMYPTLEYVAPSINNFEVTMLEPNTNYTIYAEGINKNDTINLGGTDINFNNGTVYTSGDNQWLRIDNNDSFYNMVITKGDTTGEVVPYFEGMTSVENPKVITPTKNLATIKDGSYNVPDSEVNVNVKNDGKIYLMGNARSSYTTWDLTTGERIYNNAFHDLRTLQLEPGTYTITSTLDASQATGLNEGYIISLVVCADGKNVHNHIGYYVGNNFEGKELKTTVTVENYFSCISMQRWYTGSCDGFVASIQIEKGNTATPFVPASGSTVSYTDLKLRSLPNGVKDTINVVTGEYVQRVGEVALDGSEEWTLYKEVRGTIAVYTTKGLPNTLKDKYTNNQMVTNQLNFIDSTESGEDGCYISNTGRLNLALSKTKATTINEFKNYLQLNPLIVQYELAEPITTKLDAQTLLAYNGGTINLSSDTGLLPTTHYTVPSTNTFHLASMKTGTRYTLKYPSASGSITIGDINYSISSDSMLFTTPLKINGDTSAIIFSDANPENVVLLEGAYNKREVPFFTGVKSVKNPNITIIDQLSTESTTYNCETEIELRGLPNGVADKLDIIKGKLTTNVGIRPYQEGDENLPNIWTDGYETVYALSNPVVKNVTIDRPTVTTNSLIDLTSDYLIPQLNYRAPSSNNFPLDLLQPNTTYTLYADTLTSGSYILGGTRTGVYSQPHTIILGDMTDNLLTFNGDLGLSNVMLVKGNSLKTTLPPYFLGIRSVTDGHLLVEGMAGEINELTFDEGIVLRDCSGVKDTIDLITCTLTKRTGEITLTGAEGWYRADSESTTDYNVFKLTLGGLKEALVMCDTLQSVFDTKMMDCIHAHTNELCIVIANATIGGNTVNALKSWLNQHPTTVVYQLRTPIEVQLENTWTTLPPTSYSNQTEISSTVSTNSLKPMISVTIATTTLEEIVSNLEAQNAQLEEENIATMLALTSVYETLAVPSVATTEPQVATYGLRRSAEPIGMSVSPMGMVYARLVSKGFKSIDEVPYNLQAEVMYALRGME